MPGQAKRKRMPSTSAEAIFGRVLGWVIAGGNTVITVLLIGLLPVAVRQGTSASQLVLYVAFVTAWALGACYFTVLVVLRPRHTVDDIQTASSHGDRRLTVPGSVRTSALGASVAAAWAVAALIVTTVAPPGWDVVLVIVAGLLGVVAVDQGIATRQRRYLILTPEAVEAGSFGGSSRVRWADIESIESREGLGGQLVFRVVPKAEAPSWERLTRHPLHKARRWCDVEPLSLDVDPVLLGVTLLTAWEDPKAREEISALTTSARLVEPEWAADHALSRVAALLLRQYRPERISH